MADVSRNDLLAAKKAYSTKYLRQGFSAGLRGRMASVSIRAMVATPSHNVHAIGIGKKVVEGEETQDQAVRFYVAKKLPKTLLPSNRLIPDEIDGILTDVIESDPAFITSAELAAALCTDRRQDEQRPVIAGLSVAHFEVSAGTIGYFCRSTHEQDNPAQVFLLSNNHVLADVNQADVGDAIYQPGPADGGTVQQKVGSFHRTVPIILSEEQDNAIDAAIAALDPAISYLIEICQIGAINGTEQAVEDMVVMLHGRTSGYTEGIVTDESYDALVGMDHNDPSIVALFDDQVRIERANGFPSFGLGGDSGSLVVSKEGTNAVGLYFAGPSNGFYGIANHIERVLTDLEIELL